jgi:diguanylate cyclase (GGDEF)-like protein
MEPMKHNFNRHASLGGGWVLLWLSILLSLGFFATTLLGYYVSRQAIRSTIISNDLPLTSGNIYSEIQKDLVRPVLISSTMAHDTFLRTWILGGERDVDALSRYLHEIRVQYGAFSSFFVSARTRNYYTANGVLKQVSESDPHDVWYYRARATPGEYVIDVDTDQANRNALTIFINHRVKDFEGRYLGVTGIGLTVDAVRGLIETHQARFNRTIYFVNPEGQVVLHGDNSGLDPDLRRNEGLGGLVDTILAARTGSWRYRAKGSTHILNVNYLPELKWYLFVEQNEDLALAGIRRTLYVNLGISLVISVLVILVSRKAFGRYQARIEELATTDKLTGLLNRHAFSLLQGRVAAQCRRDNRPVALLMADIDHFKNVNDSHGHGVGDQVLAGVAGLLHAGVRESDVVVRWGGEEFLLLLQGCARDEALLVAEHLRTRVAEARTCPDWPDLAVTVSIGVSSFEGTGTFEEAIDRADGALYSAKDQGRNLVRPADDFGAAAPSS